MAKKKRNVSSSNAKSNQTSKSSRLTSSSEFNPDYSYVIKDLRRIGILAVSFFVVLVALSFFLR